MILPSSLPLPVPALRQFLADQLEQGLPATTEGIKRYLGSGLVRGVGKVMAERIARERGA